MKGGKEQEVSWGGFLSSSLASRTPLNIECFHSWRRLMAMWVMNDHQHFHVCFSPRHLSRLVAAEQSRQIQIPHMYICTY